MQFPPDTQALIFDCDGTLADTMPLHYEAWLEALAPYDVEIPRSFIDTHAGMPTEVIVGEINREWRVAIDPPSFTEAKEQLFVRKIDQTRPIDPVVSIARRHHGELPLAVVSGGMRAIVQATLESIGVRHLFPIVVTADDPVAPKPSPDIFLEAAKQLGVPPERCHVFEDGDVGIRGARAAGMSVTDVREHLGAA